MPCHDWASLPCDVLGSILRRTGENPLRFAGVCKGWRWVLDDVAFRRSVIFDYTGVHVHSLYDALRSFSAFMCTRPAATVQLDVLIDVCDDAPSAACMACACLGAVLLHLAPTLQELAVQPSSVSDALVGSHFTDACPRLEYLRAHVTNTLDLGRVSSLRRVELKFTGAHAEVALPPQIQSCRCEVLDGTPSFVLAYLVAQLQRMPDLHTLDISSEYECPLDVAKLSPSLKTLVVRTPVLSDIRLAGARCTGLEVLSLHKSRLAAADLIDLLVACQGLKAFACTDYFFHDVVHPFVDLRHLPLKAVALVTNMYASRLRCLLPGGVRVLTLGPEDLGDAVQQPRVQASVETLRLSDMKYMASTVLEHEWPAGISFQRLASLQIGSCDSVRMAALLGQRCPAARIFFESAFVHDVEIDLDLLGE